MKIIEKYGKTETEAIQAALKEAGLATIENVQYELTKETPKSTFFGLGGTKNFKVKLYLYDEEENKILSVLKEFFNYMNVQIENIKIQEKRENKIYIQILPSEPKFLIGKRGKTLKALQLISNLIINKKLNKKFELILDIDKYREKREENLRKLAKNIAEKVRKTKREFILEPMPSYERKIIHETLQDTPDVGTESIGDGIYKKVKIFLKK